VLEERGPVGGGRGGVKEVGVDGSEVVGWLAGAGGQKGMMGLTGYEGLCM